MEKVEFFLKKKKSAIVTGKCILKEAFSKLSINRKVFVILRKKKIKRKKKNKIRDYETHQHCLKSILLL